MAEGLHAQITADTGSFESGMNRAKAAADGFNSAATRAASSATGLGGALGFKTADADKVLAKIATESKTANTNFGNLRNGVQQAGYQLQDFAVQVQGGTSALVALGQQGSQFLGIFGPAGAIAGAVLAVATAIGGVFAASMATAGDEAETAAEKIKRLTEETEGFNDALNKVKLFNLNSELDSAYDELRAVEDAMAELRAEMEVTSKFADTAAVSAWASQKKELEKLIPVLSAAQGKYEAIKSAIDLQIKTSEEGEKASTRQRDRVAEHIKALQIEAATLGMTDRQKALYIAGTEGATQAQLNEINALERKIELYNDENAAREAFLKSSTAIQRAREQEAAAEYQRLQMRAQLFGGAGEQGGEDAEIQAEQAKHAIKLEQLRIALEEEAIVRTEFNALIEAEQQRHADALVNIQKGGLSGISNLVRESYGKQAGLIAGSLSDILGSMSSHNKKAFELNKAVQISDAVINGYSAAVAAWDKGMKVGGPPVAAAFTAASVAKTGALIASIASQQYGSGAGGAGASAGGASSPAAQSAAEANNQIVNLSLTGDAFGRSQIVGLIGQINEAIENGARINVR